MCSGDLQSQSDASMHGEEVVPPVPAPAESLFSIVPAQPAKMYVYETMEGNIIRIEVMEKLNEHVDTDPFRALSSSFERRASVHELKYASWFIIEFGGIDQIPNSTSSWRRTIAM